MAGSSLFVALTEVVSWTVQTVPCLVNVARRVQVVKRIEKKEEKEEEGLPGRRTTQQRQLGAREERSCLQVEMFSNPVHTI